MAGRQWVKEMLKDFVFSFSQGAAAAAQNPGARGGMASLAASLQAPQLRQDLLKQKETEEADRQLKIQQIRQQLLSGQQDQAFKMIEALRGSQQPTMTMGDDVIGQKTFERPIAPVNVPGMGNVGIPNRSDVMGGELEKYAQQQKIQADANIYQTNATRQPPTDTSVTEFDLWRQQNPGKSINDWIDLKQSKTTPTEPNQQSREVVRNGRTVLQYFKGSDPSKVTFEVDMGPIKDKTDDPLTSYQRNQTFMSISNKYQADPIVNVAVRGQTAKAIADQIIKNPEKATNQLSSLYLYVKNLDPESAVREGETALAQLTQSYTQRFATSLKRISEGQILSPQAAKEMAQATKDLISAWESTAKTRTSQYKSQAGIAGVGTQFDQYLAGFGGIAGSGGASGSKTIKFGDLPK